MCSSLWPTCWNPELHADCRKGLEAELQRELPHDHILAGAKFIAQAILVRDPDWVAYSLSDGRAAAVHLTRRIESDPRWPYTALYDSIESLKADRDEFG